MSRRSNKINVVAKSKKVVNFDAEKKQKRLKELKLLGLLGDIRELELEKSFNLEVAWGWLGDCKKKFTCDFYYFHVKSKRWIAEIVPKDSEDYKQEKALFQEKYKQLKLVVI